MASLCAMWRASSASTACAGLLAWCQEVAVPHHPVGPTRLNAQKAKLIQ